MSDAIDPSAVLAGLRRARPGDPFVEWHADAAAIEDLVTDADHVAWTRLSRHGTERWATVLGDDGRRVTALLRALDRSTPLDGITVHDGVYSTLPQELRAPFTGHWCLWVLEAKRLTEVTRAQAAGAAILDVDDPRIDVLLRHSESAHVFAGSPSIVRWAGVEVGERLVAVAGQEVAASGAAHLVSVCTDPGRRGQGHARTACARLIVEAEASGCPVTMLEMYAANAPGRALYSSLGFTETGRYRSGLLRPDPSAHAEGP